MLLGWQAVWGALFIRAFGFSFNVLRVSNLLVAGATVYLVHQVLLRFGVNRRNAVFGALTLAMTPLFLPLAASFMTDVPGLFSVVLCLAMCQRAVAARTDRSAVGWLVAASATNLATGTVRQICWLGALVMVPATAWLLRRRRGVPVATALAWLASLGVIFGCVWWLNRQPWTFPEHVLLGRVTGRRLAHLGTQFIKALLTVVWVTAPVNVALLLVRARRKTSIALLLGGAVLVLSVGFALLWKEDAHTSWAMPWLMPMLDAFGPGLEPVVFNWKTRVVITVLTVAMAILLAVQTLALGTVHVVPRSTAGRARVALLGPFSLAVIAMIAPRGMYLYLQDRYLLLLLPAVLVWSLLRYQRFADGPLPLASWCVLLIFAVYTVAVVHDEYASMRTEWRALEQAEARGVPRDEVAVGFGPDEWFEVGKTGRVNHWAFAGTPRSYQGPMYPWPVSPPCLRFDWNLVPHLHPRWFVAHPGDECFTPGPFPPLTFSAWLPPFHRTRQVMAPREAPPAPR